MAELSFCKEEKGELHEEVGLRLMVNICLRKWPTRFRRAPCDPLNNLLSPTSGPNHINRLFNLPLASVCDRTKEKRWHFTCCKVSNKLFKRQIHTGVFNHSAQVEGRWTANYWKSLESRYNWEKAFLQQDNVTTQVMVMTLTMSPDYLGVPISHDTVCTMSGPR